VGVADHLHNSRLSSSWSRVEGGVLERQRKIEVGTLTENGYVVLALVAIGESQFVVNGDD